jgi:hypothetical protein
VRPLGKFNLITILFILLFIVPILTGGLRAFTKESIRSGFLSILDNLEFIACIFFAFFLTRKIFFENEKGIFKVLYNYIPLNLRNAIYSKEILTYIVAVPIILLILLLVVRLITNPIYNFFIIPFSNRIYYGLFSMNSFSRRCIGALSQLPKAFFVVFVLGLLLNFYTYYFYSPMLTKWMNESEVYQLIYKRTINPVLNSSLAKQIPVIVNNSFDKNVRQLLPNTLEGGSVKDLINNIAGGKIRVIEYFNGVTLAEAIKSNDSIDKTAKDIIGKEKNDTKKAYLLYKWICRNLKYDYAKAQKISADPAGISSGSIIAFTSRKGICFDYSSLYVSMCRAVGLKVRLVTGMGFSGSIWGDHAWNQVYSSEETRWINVDTTFGTTSNYFDKPNFNEDHRAADIQGEW